MKYLIILFTYSCSLNQHPKFLLGDLVKYPIPAFYIKVCSGKGIVKHFSGMYQYGVETPWNEKGCPLELIFEENELSLIK